MTTTLASALLSFPLASFISASELITRNYPRTYFPLWRCGWLYVYAVAYGAAAFLVSLVFDNLVAAGAIRMEGIGLASPWIRALYIGATTKAMLNISFVTVTVGNQSSPVGPSTLVQLHEPMILRNIILGEFNEVRKYVRAAVDQNPDLAAVKRQIEENVPGTLPASERGAF